MTSSNGDQIVAAYIARLEAALAEVPADRREEIVGEIRSHIAESRARLTDETEAGVRNLLERVGDPEALAAEAAPTEVTPVRRWGALEIAALILTPLIWPIGVILLWLSPAWSIRDKLIGTLLPPGGYLTLIFALPTALLGTASVCSGGTDGSGVYHESCTGIAALPQWEQVVIGVGTAIGLLLLLVLPVLVAIYLAIRLRRSGSVRPAHNARRDGRASRTGGSATVS